MVKIDSDIMTTWHKSEYDYRFLYKKAKRPFGQCEDNVEEEKKKEDMYIFRSATDRA